MPPGNVTGPDRNSGTSKQRKGTEDPARSFGEDQDQRKCRQHLIQMILGVKPADDHQLDQGARDGSTGKCRHEAQQKRSGCSRNSRRAERPDHVKRTMGKVDQTHDAEDQGQPGGHQKQHDAELQAVQNLLYEQYQ